MKTKTIAITPMGKPRMTQRDRWKGRAVVQRYHAFCDELRLKYRGELPENLFVAFCLPMPASWSNKKKLAYAGQPHRQKPDIDNLCKAVMDALAQDDSYIYGLYAQKHWADTGSIVIADLKEQINELGRL